MKRILPAVIFSLVLFVPFCAILLLPSNISFLRSVDFVLLGNANYYFWRDGGYFGLANELKPLLHFWSLSVELQFYLIVCLFAIVFKPDRHVYLFLLFFLCITSILIREFLFNIDGVNPAFFLTPTRLWEFCFGGLAFLIQRTFFNSKEIVRFGANEFQACLFVVIVVLGLFADEITSFSYRNNYLIVLLCVALVLMPASRLPFLFSNQLTSFLLIFCFLIFSSLAGHCSP